MNLSQNGRFVNIKASNFRRFYLGTKKRGADPLFIRLLTKWPFSAIIFCLHQKMHFCFCLKDKGISALFECIDNNPAEETRAQKTE